ncbi:MAG: hypothetical protein K2U26_19720 [Cyclobacteriaceae bacterium]|nr:hypothetical protein [Cyclobacteriaceae bacterium]
MNVAVKKIELIKWLARLQDEKLIHRVEALRASSIKEAHASRTPKNIKDLEVKLKRSKQDIEAGRVHTQEEVEKILKARFAD